MKTISCHLQKGGVGKTTLSVSLAWELAAAGHSTVLVDLDPQGNTSGWLLEGRHEPEYELADVLLGRVDLQAALIQVDDDLQIIPTFGIGGGLNAYGKSGLAAEPYVVTDTLKNLTAEFCVIDMGPGLGSIETAGLLAIDEVILVMTAEVFGLDGLATWAAEIEKIERGLRFKVHYERLIINGLNRTISQMNDVYEQAKRHTRKVYTIGTEPAFRKAQAEHLPAQLLTKAEAMKPENRQELQRLAKDLCNGTR